LPLTNVNGPSSGFIYIVVATYSVYRSSEKLVIMIASSASTCASLTSVSAGDLSRQGQSLTELN